VVESGFFDSIGLYRKCSDAESQVSGYLFDALHIDHLKERSFLRISSGEQRLILFARALVKNPELLILDEPFHGLDDDRKRDCLRVVESYCRQPDKSLIFVTHQPEEIPSSIHLRKYL
jgi:molybdate transport system ATP-binding protein